MANAIIGPLFGVLLAVYAYGVWTLKRWVVPLAAAYAVYVVINLVVFSLNPPPGSQTGAVFMLAYALVAIAVSTGGALYLHRNRHRFS
jgi:uncharacterized membrane protein (DUF2068 family)